MPSTSTESTQILAPATGGARYLAERAIPIVRILPAAPPEKRERHGRKLTLREVPCRMVNVLVAAFGIVATAPLMILIAVMIKLSSPGPVFYTQKRVGLDRRGGIDRRTVHGREASQGRRNRDQGGTLFRIYKFRTMTAGSGHQPQVWAQTNDARITPLGGVLRKYRLDELPQFFNVLLGDMNIVGPRPEQPEIFSQLKVSVDRYGERQRVLPGITGWAQVNHPYDQSLDDVKKKVDLDLQYIRSRSLVEDLRIMAMTVPVMVGRKGAI